MSSGEQTCQHPPRECPCAPRPPSALTQLRGEGCHPHHWAALQPVWLTQTICSGLQGRASGQHFFLGTRMAFVSHDCLWLAYCFPQYVISESILHILRKRGTNLCFVFAVYWNAWQSADSCAVLLCIDGTEKTKQTKSHFFVVEVFGLQSLCVSILATAILFIWHSRVLSYQLRLESMVS